MTPRAKRPTLAEFKRFSRDVAPAARAVLMARIHEEMERERVDAYILPIFQAYHFETLPTIHNAPPPLKPKDLYLCADEVQVAAYFEDCDKAHRDHGFTGPHGHCPALVAESMRMTVENALIKLAEPLFGIKVGDVYGDDRVKYLELLISAAIKAESEAA